MYSVAVVLALISTLDPQVSMLIAVVVCSLTPGERLFVRSITKSTLSQVVSSGSFVFCGSVVCCGLLVSCMLVAFCCSMVLTVLVLV